jgi:23S rRNA (cytidine1920-2'-O)/16S rRNA (cytidine1409-2'-O)-methyltransferase
LSSNAKNNSKKKKSSKARVDVLLVRVGLADDVEQAKRMVMAGEVYSDTLRINKPGDLVSEDKPLSVKGRKPHPWVSRGALKLLGAIEHFKLDVKNVVAIDVGSSTGGFTDILLHKGARKVFAVDVGYGELAWKLMSDERVVVLERTNARDLTDTHITEAVDMVVCDASFTTLDTVLPRPLTFLKAGGFLVALIKPQFEVKKHEVGEGGIVRDATLHKRVCDYYEASFTSQKEWNVLGIIESPITGMQGNKEFLLVAEHTP